MGLMGRRRVRMESGEVLRIMIMGLGFIIRRWGGS